VADDDEVMRAAVLGAGFEVADDGGAELVGPSTGLFLDAEGVVADPPQGYRVRDVRDDELAARVEVHRAAWRPASLPWPPGTAPEVDPEATSRFTAELYERVRATWLYDQTLDLVVEAPDGALAACCICWWDPATGCAEIEPLGVVPEHRRRGLAGALCHGAAERVAARAGRRVYINSDPGMRYSVPAAAYLAAGFVSERRGTVYGRSRS
jgi:GNAT superfamily N-acetyltransferase